MFTSLPLKANVRNSQCLQVRSFADASFLSGDGVTERVLETLKLVEKVDASNLSSDAHFKNDLGLDSLDVVEVVMAIEEEFMVEIPDADAEKIQSCKGSDCASVF